ncbi:hypothetical protein ARMSODRAFT_978751 [Armillaria solidipes]|uniref:Uncharacterized protein n=1 Tax=Armillaria solidipes TaxID=1076256 RepID=A0A2H3BLN7_9AGAR|nr:hypothetical protein ARMSODRAFT_978751 [Armillaria solidipes]
MVVGTMQSDGGFVASQDPLTTIDRAKYYDLQKNGDIFVCDLFQESSVQPTAPTTVITNTAVVKMDRQQPDTTMIKPKSNAPDLQSKEFIDLIKDAMGFGTEPDDQEVVDAKAMLAIDALKKQILIERCWESLHQNGWKSGDIKSVDMYKVPSCPEVPETLDYMPFAGSQFDIIEVIYKKVFRILKMTANIYKSLFGDKVCRNNPNIIGEWFNNPDRSDFQQYAEMALGTFSTTIQNVKRSSDDEGCSCKKGKHWVQSSPESSSALSRSQLPVEVHKKMKMKKDDEHMASSSTKMPCDNTKIFHDSSKDGDINYLKMHDIKMHKSNSAYELDGNQLGEQ